MWEVVQLFGRSRKLYEQWTSVMGKHRKPGLMKRIYNRALLWLATR